MPDPAKYTDKQEWMDACMSRAKEEGREHDQSVAMCLNMWSREKEAELAVGLIKLANDLDSKGLTAEADEIDRWLGEPSPEGPPLSRELAPEELSLRDTLSLPKQKQYEATLTVKVYVRNKFVADSPIEAKRQALVYFESWKQGERSLPSAELADVYVEELTE